jgi:transposase
MRLIGCDLHASQQSIAMLDRDTGEIVEQTLAHEGGTVREFYASIPRPVVVGIEATGSMGWFLRLMEELAIECRVGHPTAIRKAETRRQKHDRRDAALLLQLLAEDRFPAIWMPSTECRDLRSLLLHRHQWVRMRTRVQNALHAIVLAHGVRRGHTLWNCDGQALLASLPLPPHTADRRSELQALYQHLQGHIDRLDDRVEHVANERARATLLMTHPGVGPVTALATEVFVGDPARFLDGKALSSYVGMIPREYSSGKRQRLGALSKQGNPFLRFLWCERPRMPSDVIPICSASIDGRSCRRDSRKPASQRRGSSEFASGSCCAIRLITRSSAVVGWRGSRRGGARAGMPVSALVLVRE